MTKTPDPLPSHGGAYVRTAAGSLTPEGAAPKTPATPPASKSSKKEA